MMLEGRYETMPVLGVLYGVGSVEGNSVVIVVEKVDDDDKYMSFVSVNFPKTKLSPDGIDDRHRTCGSATAAYVTVDMILI
jgi:hypothetical protein